MGRFLITFGLYLWVVFLCSHLSAYYQKNIVHQQRDKGKWRSTELAKNGSYRKKGNALYSSHNSVRSASSNSLAEVENSQLNANEGSVNEPHIDETELKSEPMCRRKRAAIMIDRTNGTNNTTIPINSQTMRAIVDKYDYCHSKGLADTCAAQVMCSCEDDCVIYGDCCLDAHTQLEGVAVKLIKSIGERLECVGITIAKTYKIVTSCAPEFANTFFEEKCVNINKTNVLSIVPVYDRKLRVSFRNIYCARCNGVSISNLMFWTIRLRRCDFMTPNAMYGLREFIDQQLNLPKSFCKIIAIPRSNFRSGICFKAYSDEYLCDGYNLPNSSDLLAELPPQVSVSITNSTTFSSTAANSSVQHFNLGPALLTNETHSSLKRLCMAYKNVVRNRTAHRFRNSVCAWCKIDIDFERSCQRPLEDDSRDIPLTDLINFHSALSIVREEETKGCKENEILDSLILANWLRKFSGCLCSPAWEIYRRLAVANLQTEWKCR